MRDHRFPPPGRRASALALAALCAGPAAGAGAAEAPAASAAPLAPPGAVARPAGFEGIGSLVRLIEALGRGPDRTEDGGACGGIVIHDWLDEDLRVITQGDRVQSVTPLGREARTR